MVWWWSPLKHTKKIVWCSGEVIVRGIVLTPQESRRATLVECVIEYPHLCVLVLVAPNCWVRLVNAY
jgi:hypothetical protein